VEVRTGALVTRITPDAVWVGGEQIRSRAVLWAAGVAAAPLAAPRRPARSRRTHSVAPDLSVPGHPEIFVAGDLCAFSHGTEGPLPGVAPVAIQQGRAAAVNAGAALPARTRCPSAIATAAAWPPWAAPPRSAWSAPRLSGLPAWLAWLGRAHRVSHRLPEPLPRALRVGMGLYHLEAGRRLITGCWRGPA
jgi:NADH dehydrogenase